MAIVSATSLLMYSQMSVAVVMASAELPEHDAGNMTDSESEETFIKLASLHYDHVKEPLIFTCVALAAAIFKLGFHKVTFLSSILPESCMLIAFGLAVGLMLHVTNIAHVYDGVIAPSLSPKLFFVYLLPPIVLEASFSLHDRVFIDNLGTILVYAVLGTLFNCFLIGPILYGLSQSSVLSGLSEPLTLTQAFVFASLIVAVDPVAVLAIFQEIGVNNVLYFLVFGESLLNDAVTIVLYRISQTFSRMSTVPISQVFMGILQFFSVSFGGVLIGVLCGVICALFTRFTRDVRVLEVLFVFAFAYASYLVADMFELSGIIAMICCGLVQAEYVFENVSDKSRITIEYFINMHGSMCDAVIFMYLGLSLLEATTGWHIPFLVWTIVLCTVVRFIGVILLTWIANKKRLHKVAFEEQFIMAYGGLRGAVAFSLVEIISPHRLLPSELVRLFRTTTLGVILFTVFIQGISIKPLVKLFRIKRSEEKEGTLTIFDELNNHVIDHILSGVEQILGLHGHNYFRQLFSYYNDRYIKPILMYSPVSTDERIMNYYQKVALQQHMVATRRTLPRDQPVVFSPTGESSKTCISHGLASTLAGFVDPFGPRDVHLTTSDEGRIEDYPSDSTLHRHRLLEDVEVDFNKSPSGSAQSLVEPSRTGLRVDIRTSKDFRNLLIKPHQLSNRRNFRRNITGTRDDFSDIQSHLRDKQRRTFGLIRMNTALGNQSVYGSSHAGSVLYSKGGSRSPDPQILEQTISKLRQKPHQRGSLQRQNSTTEDPDDDSPDITDTAL